MVQLHKSKQSQPFGLQALTFTPKTMQSIFCMASHGLQLSSSTEICLLMIKIIIQIIINYPKIPHPFVFGRHRLTFVQLQLHTPFRTQNVQNITSNVTPARAKALKSPTVPSTAVKTKPSFWAVIVYSKSLWSGPTLQIKEQNLFQKKHLDTTYTLSSKHCILTEESKGSKQICSLPVSAFGIGENCGECRSCSLLTNDNLNTFQFRMNLPFQK